MSNPIRPIKTHGEIEITTNLLDGIKLPHGNMDCIIAARFDGPQCVEVAEVNERGDITNHAEFVDGLDRTDCPVEIFWLRMGPAGTLFRALARELESQY